MDVQPHRVRKPLVPSCIEPLESRRLLSALLTDIAGLKLSATPYSLLPGGSLSAQRNYQVIAAPVIPAFLIRYRLSANRIWGDGDDVAIPEYESIAQRADKAMGLHSATRKLTVPAATKPGTYYLMCRLDASNTVVEASERNNAMVGNQVQVLAQANDVFAYRKTITGAAATASGTNINSTRESLEPLHAGSTGGKSVWWTWTAPDSGRAVIDTIGSSFDTLLGVYLGSEIGKLSDVAGNNNLSSTSTASRVIFNAARGQAYQIAVDGLNGASGSVRVNVKLTPGVLDDRQAGFLHSSLWKEINGSYQGKQRYSASGSGVNIATWTFSNLPSGTYRVSTTWLNLTAAASNAPFTVYDGTELLGTVAVNQKFKPSGTSFDGATWQSLGNFTVAGGNLVITLANNADGYVLADGVRIEPQANSAIVIDHNSIAALDTVAQTTLDAVVSQLNFFFAHASVGGNLMDGIAGLSAHDPTRYKLTVVPSDVTPPSTLLKGRIYEYDRGNPGWQAKVDEFADALANGWGNRASVVLNKFCFIDPDVSLQYYAISNSAGTAMSQLESLYPSATFVYMTIPLTTDSDSDNILRNTFNAQLRNWTRANNKVLFDIADIESHDPDGTAQTFTSDGHAYEMLYGEYSSDGGHLNDSGAQRAALGFYALGAALLARS
jgi:hypothetical protein